MTKLEVSSNQRNLTNNNAVKLCERLSGLVAQAFPDKMTAPACTLLLATARA